MKTVTATEFKAKCLAILDEVNQSGDPVTITKRGVAVATVQPAAKKKWKSLLGCLAGKVKIVGDIDTFSFADDWECVRLSDAAEARAARRPRRKAS
ncbi:MAG: type II toxin-antitoxin system Phd/YefM family antitoxin [Acidobacteriota bacterium]